jgi:4-diphosphocytidyl-2C-methyl-D-erythritol kinase
MEVPSVFESLSHPLDVDVPVFIAEGGLFVGGVNGWGEQLASLLEEATVLTFPTRSAELAYAPPPCLRELRNEFVVDPGPVEGGEECEKQSEPIEFVAPS